MQNAKKTLFKAGIIEFILAVLYLVFNGIYTASWLDGELINISKQIFTTCTLFVLAVVFAVDAILSVKYSKAEDDTTRRCQSARRFMAIVFIIMAISAFVIITTISVNSANLLTLFASSISLVLFIIEVVLNFRCASYMDAEVFTRVVKKDEKIEVIRPIQIDKQSDLDLLIEKLNSLKVLRDKELISDEDFETLRNEIIKKHKK